MSENQDPEAAETTHTESIEAVDPAAICPAPLLAARRMDWQQVVMNGGPPCFAILEGERGNFCGRAHRWEGHDSHHAFVSLEDLLRSVQNTEGLASPAGSENPKL
jgi:hypothetical protein